MQIYFDTDAHYSAVVHNAHVCTASTIRVPADATVMKVTYMESMEANYYGSMCFGLLKPDCEAATVPSTGGVLSDWLTTFASMTTVSLNISSLDLTQDWMAVVNFRHRADDGQTVADNIFKVWFE